MNSWDDIELKSLVNQILENKGSRNSLFEEVISKAITYHVQKRELKEANEYLLAYFSCKFMQIKDELFDLIEQRNYDEDGV